MPDMKKIICALPLLLTLFLNPVIAQAQQQYVPISQLPIPPSGSNKLSTGDKVAANRGNVTYGLLAGFGSNCSTSQWVNTISPQGFGTCAQPTFADISGSLPVAQIAGVYTNGQLLIGNTSSGHLQAGSIAAGSNITVTNSAGGITIAASAVTSGVDIGTSLSAANPLIAGDATSGFYTSGAGHVGTIISGALIGDYTSAGLSLGTNTLALTGSIGSTGSRVLKGWFTDLQVTNAISGSVTGNAATATALQNARTIGGVSFNGTANTTVASATGGFTVSGGNLTVSGVNIVTDTTTGTDFGTATSQKLGFYGATPIVQPSGAILTALSNLGLVATPSLNFSALSGNATNAQLASQTANTVLGALTATTPSGLAVPSCSGATSGLTWTSGVGFGCNTFSVFVATAPTVQTFLSGSGTYSTPANVKWIEVKMVGGGAGGGGSGTGSPGNGGNGGNTTFGTTLLSAGGGTGGAFNGTASAGGTSSLGSGPSGMALPGGTGGAAFSGASTFENGGFGGGSALGGAGAGGFGVAGSNGATNTGSGGGGGGSAGTIVTTAAGGGSGGYVAAIITAPSATYSYAVGAAGTAGTAGTNGFAGGAGGSGGVWVTEHYNY